MLPNISNAADYNKKMQNRSFVTEAGGNGRKLASFFFFKTLLQENNGVPSSVKERNADPPQHKGARKRRGAKVLADVHLSEKSDTF